MSREVLEPAGDAGAAPQDSPPPRPGPATDLETGVVLGAPRLPRQEAPASTAAEPHRPDGDAPPRPRPPTPGRVAWPGWAQGPRAAVAALLAGLLVGALVAGTLAERAQQRAVAGQVSVLAGIAPPRGGGGDDGVDTTLEVVNAGPRPLTVVGVAVNGGSDELALREDARVEAGEHRSLPLRVRPACGGAVGDDLALTVRTDEGRTVTADAAALGRPLLQPAQLRDLCRREQPVEIWRVLARRDGVLTVQLLNTGEAQVAVDVATPSGSSVTSAPPLPVAVQAGSSAFLELSLQVDTCSSAVQSADAGAGVRLTVDGERGPGFDRDAAAVGGWFARQVALACAGD